MNKTFWGSTALGVLALAVAGCSSAEPAKPASPTAAAAQPTAAAAAGVAFDKSYGKDGISLLPLSANAHDRFYTVVPGPGDTTYAVGFVGEGADQAFALAKVDATGKLDKSFGKEGVASVNVAIGGKALELARGLTVQSTGKIVIAGPVEHDVTATGNAAKDTDVALVRFDNTGKIDTTFGKAGVAIFDLGTGKAISETAFVGDTSWGLANLPGDKLMLWGSKLADGANRTDADYVALGVTATGTLDTAFGTNGKISLDVNSGGAENPRNVLVQPDGKIIATGYSVKDGVTWPVMVRMSAAGVLDKDFGTNGLATTKILAGVTESYNVTMQGDKYILAGYGRGADPTEKVDLVMERYDSKGVWDKSFGTEGLLRIDIAKEDDRARNVLVLPDGRIIAAGSGKKTAANVDAMLIMATKDGQLDKTFGDGGILISDLGGPADSWYGLTLTADKKHIVVAGYKGTDATSGGNDDTVIARLTL